MSRIFYKYNNDGTFNGFLMEQFSPITKNDVNLIEINPDVHLVGMDETLILKDLTNIPTELITLDNLEQYFNKESNTRNANIIDDNAVIMQQLASNKLELMKKNMIINKLTSQVATNKIDIIKIKKGEM